MNVYDAIQTRRSIRKFKQNAIPHEDLVKLVDCARLAPYGANMQPLKFMVIDDEKRLADMFPATKWAAYLPDGSPKEEERPVAYIAILGDRNIKANGSFDVEAGAAGTTMILEAMELGIASCWLGALDRGALKKVLALPEHLELIQLVAFGYPAQKSRAVEYQGDVKYFVDGDGAVNVPKRSLDEVLVK